VSTLSYIYQWIIDINRYHWIISLWNIKLILRELRINGLVNSKDCNYFKGLLLAYLILVIKTNNIKLQKTKYNKNCFKIKIYTNDSNLRLNV